VSKTPAISFTAGNNDTGDNVDTGEQFIAGVTDNGENPNVTNIFTQIFIKI
jgi:hypothetical protein